jgi:hypothetical protein
MVSKYLGSIRLAMWLNFMLISLPGDKEDAVLGGPTSPDATHARSYQLAGRCARRKLRTRLIVLAFSSRGSRHGKTVISAFGQNEATSTEDTSGWAGTSSGRTRMGVWLPLIDHTLEAAVVKPKTAGAPSTPGSGR